MSDSIKRALTYAELRNRKGIAYARQHLSRLEKADLFPPPIVVGVKRIGWLEHEIDGHLERAAAARDVGRAM